MKALTPNDLWPLPLYESVREKFRQEVIAAKQARRLPVGPFMTFVFENRLTVKFQVQEILRVERISAAQGVTQELEGFNTMLPGDGELSATLMIELQGSDAEVKAQLARLTGLGDHLWLDVGGERLHGQMEGGRDDGQRVSAVQYVRFPVSDRERLLAGPAALVIDHPGYAHREALGDETRRSLAADLA